ncbi:glycoside hydrolase family 16 protein [Sphingomonas naphthae]|uniref:Glycoside hydrolase family 16 protein n=1 Tax=Sphingomonas naphthae TaxID=1813468 RepID=A0ABY7TFB2_9SPHN|nr:glycoside hydrolase family 16 protein [Sphingomonas naphthae]WCT71898.1 glycoside hydrolase family 16 protein [Sphingomonas naphthae]
MRFATPAGLCATALLACAMPLRADPPAGLALEPSFTENFDSPRLDPARWTTNFGGTGQRSENVAKRSLYGNRERQLYFDKAFLGAGIDPFTIRRGILTITARPLPAPVQARVQAALAKQPAKIQQSALKDVRYSSGLITTAGSFSQAYGYFEMRARWTMGKGVWPAFWLLPAGGGWPPEIDVIEAHGDKPTTAFQSLHSRLQKAITRKVAMDGSAAQFHDYGVLWTPETLDYYIDGRKTASIPTSKDAAKPMYLLANLAIGGHWPGDPDATTVMPARMEIDHIRAWRFRTPPG